MLKYSSTKRTLLTASVLFGLALAAVTGVSCYASLPDDITVFDDLREAPVDPAGVFLNNIGLALSSILLALPTLGLYPLGIMLTNVTTLALLIKYLAESERQVLIFKLIPHGVIELFGLALSVALVLTFAIDALKTVPSLIRGDESLKRFCRGHVAFLVSGIVVEIIIFLIAAGVETAVSYVKLL